MVGGVPFLRDQFDERYGRFREEVIAKQTCVWCGWEVIYPVLSPISNGAGTMVLRVVFLFLLAAFMLYLALNKDRLCLRLGVQITPSQPNKSH